ncbi:unnamed protein product [Meloidogyne enterolobii]|uniref:Uncharacterized protein n=1 Tax=Meloidogyne enterolobii TaxID=390850 RepID=A0ACB0Z9Y0_MELEN
MFTLLPQIKYLDGFDINDSNLFNKFLFLKIFLEEDLSDESEDGEENFGDDKFNSDYEEVFEKKVDGKLNNFQTKLSLVESKNKEAMEVLEKKMNEEIQKLKSEHQNEIKNLKESFQQIIEEKIKEIKETKETQKKIDELEEDTASQKSDLSNGFELLTYNENKL